ncbi:rod shape-determining protein MreD [Clostridium sp. AM58-1XD]|uniref:rod shape-determining protein MreD n=1 Tax=Clostridium sp. AM58-1XD TaxID=2292307 RepID=UPI000E4C3C27|nr:rod shape-determining protein MreD [Clostridium sp. AM58-1XD]RGZ01477.1 rod shape-determining protein MreD [Clostridium sp. AM58-1XD]
MKKRLLNLVLILLAFAVQNCIFPQLPFLSASPNLLLILTFSFGFIHGRDAGMFCGFCSGILLDLFYSGPFGFYTLFYVWMGYANGIFTKYYYEDYITFPLALSFINDLMYNMYIYIFRFLIRNRLDFFYYFRSIMVPEIIFTVITTLLIYRIVLAFTRKMEEWEQRRDTTIV